MKKPAASNKRMVVGSALAWMSLGFTGVIVAGFLVVSGLGLVPVQHIYVNGNLRVLTQDKVEDVVKQVPRRNLLLMDIQRMQDLIVALAWVNDVDIQRIWPDALRVSIHEHQAIAQWDGDTLLGSDGALFHPSRDSMPKNLPSVDAPPGLNAAVAGYLVAFNTRLDKAQMAIKSVQVDERGVWRLRLRNGLRLVLGRDAVEKRLDRFIIALPGLGKVENIAAVDLRYDNGIAVQWKNKPTGKHG